MNECSKLIGETRIKDLPNEAPMSKFQMAIQNSSLAEVMSELWGRVDPGAQIFLESLQKGLEKYKSLTPKQLAALEKIYLNHS